MWRVTGIQSELSPGLIPNLALCNLFQLFKFCMASNSSWISSSVHWNSGELFRDILILDSQQDYFLVFFKPDFFYYIGNLIYFSRSFMLTTSQLSAYVWHNKQSWSSYCIAPNGKRKRAGSIQLYFCFHWTAKCDRSLGNRQKSNPI